MDRTPKMTVKRKSETVNNLIILLIIYVVASQLVFDCINFGLEQKKATLQKDIARMTVEAEELATEQEAMDIR